MSDVPFSPLRVLTSEAQACLDRVVLAEDIPFIEIGDPFVDEQLADLELEMPAPGTAAARLALRNLGFGFRRLDELFGSPELLERLGRVSGERTLIYDFDYEFGGPRQTAAREPQRLTLALHKRQWRRRLTLVVVLDPAWRGGGPKAPPPLEVRRCRLFLLRSSDWSCSFELTPPPPPIDPSCRCIIAHYYAQGASSERATPATLLEPPFEDRLRAAAGDGSRVEKLLDAELALLCAGLVRHGNAAAAVVERHQTAFRQRSLNLSGPLAADEIETLTRLPGTWHRALDLLAEAERTADEMAALGPTFSTLPIEGAARVLSQHGAWRDGWVSTVLYLRLAATTAIRALVIEGAVPEALRDTQRLFAWVDESLYWLLPPVGEFRWRFTISHAPAEPILLRITTSQSWCPAEAGVSTDRRPLAWHLRRVLVEG